MVQRDNGLKAVGPAARDHLAVMRYLGLVEAALLGLDACPFNGKAVGVQARRGHETDVLRIAAVMAARVEARLGVGRVLHVLLRPAVAVDVAALHLMGGGGRPYKKAFFKFLRQNKHSPICFCSGRARAFAPPEV